MAGSDGAAGAGGAAGAAGTEDGAAGENAAEVAPATGAAGAGMPAGDGTGGPIPVTWTFKYCGDNATSVGVVDQTTNKGLAGPIQVEKPRGNVFVLKAVMFSCTLGDIVCWSASTGAGMCGVCSDGAMPVIGC